MTHPLIQRLHDEFGYPALDLEGVEAFLGEPGVAVLFFPGDPARFKDTTDVAVVLPELVRAFNGRLRAAVVTDPDTDKALYARYEFGKWPSLVFMQGERKLGHITGIKDWGVYLQRATEMLNSADTAGAA
jgi:hydrogenase-1 operon protein HyaE